jgi:putative sterol carrier protein
MGWREANTRTKFMRAQFRLHVSIALAVLAAMLCSHASGATVAEKESVIPQDVFDGMRQSFRAEKAKGMHIRYQFDLSGPNGGGWWIQVDDGKFKMGKGTIEHPDVTFIASDKDWVALSNGTLGGTWAFLTGRLKIHGDQNLARKLDEIFS